MKKNLKGFTLIEQLIVMAIIVSLVGLSVVGVAKTYRENNIKNVTENLQTVFRFLQVKSIEEGKVYELSFSEDGKSIRVKRKVLGKEDLEVVRSSWIGSIQAGHALKFQFERSGNLQFYPDGLTSKNPLLVVKENGERVTLLMKNRIGTVEVKGA